MTEKTFETPYGAIHYWMNDFTPARQCVVFLPGLTADHRLFAKQIPAFEQDFNILVWDAPGHNESRPFRLEFTLEDKALWLHGILAAEGIEKPVLVGQSMGGYVSQMYLELFPDDVSGFISIDSAPLQRQYYTGIELWLLRNITPMYKMYPWKALVRDGSWGCAESEYGRQMMREIMHTYDNDTSWYCNLAGHGYRILAEAVSQCRPYEIKCLALLICGKCDKAGSARSYNRRWAEKTGIKIEWIDNAGHNANTDKPEEINQLIGNFLSQAIVSESQKITW